LLKTQIPIRTDNWDITRSGFLEADTVAHCGGSLEGDFIWSVTYCDILSGWTCNRAVWNKGAHGIVEATRSPEASLPFELFGFDTDKGSEFLNWHLLRYFQERKKAVGFTRSRPLCLFHFRSFLLQAPHGFSRQDQSPFAGMRMDPLSDKMVDEGYPSWHYKF
jgi:hypothetical protein